MGGGGAKNKVDNTPFNIYTFLHLKLVLPLQREEWEERVRGKKLSRFKVE